ncbi:MAG: hypothetical protein NVS3B13_38150 [Mucilaginibacter sp.]
MKKLIMKLTKMFTYVFILAFVVMGLNACGQEVKKDWGTKSNKTLTNAGVKMLLIPVEGMSCGSCASHVKKSIKFLQGINSVEVSLEKRQAKVSYLPQKISPAKIQEAISASGYKAGKPVVQKDE